MPAEDSWLERTIQELNRLNPTVKIELRLEPGSEEAATSGGAPPDVMYVSGFALPDLIANQQIAEIGNGVSIADIPPSLRPGFVKAGTTYCYPQSANALALFYNRAMFSDAGLSYPDATWTWSEFSAAAEALTDPNVTAFGFVMPADLSRWLTFYYSAGGQHAMDGEMKLEPRATQQATEFLAGLYAQGFAGGPEDTTSTWSGEAFGKGRAGMAIEGTWLAAYLQANYPRLDYGVAELPSAANKGSVLFTTCLGVSESSAHPELARALAGQLTHPELLRERMAISLDLPPYDSLLAGWQVRHPELAPFAATLAYGHLWQVAPNQGPAVQEFNSILQAVFAGDMDAADAVPRFPFVAGSLP